MNESENWAQFKADWQSDFYVVRYDRVASTMQAVRDPAVIAAANGGNCLVVADYQTDGHGQVGNHWESEAGQNLLFSFSLHPSLLQADRQFLLSEIVSLALVDALKPYLTATVKWPNDIYVGDKKICGMLLEHRVMGARLQETVIGIGLNVNQVLFCSNAPNPVSIRSIVGHEVERFQLLNRFFRLFMDYYAELQADHDLALHQRYLQQLYRREGFHLYRDESGHTVRARMVTVGTNGELVLEHTDGRRQSYCFKQISYLID